MNPRENEYELHLRRHRRRIIRRNLLLAAVCILAAAAIAAVLTGCMVPGPRPVPSITPTPIPEVTPKPTPTPAPTIEPEPVHVRKFTIVFAAKETSAGMLWLAHVYDEEGNLVERRYVRPGARVTMTAVHGESQP